MLHFPTVANNNRIGSFRSVAMPAEVPADPLTPRSIVLSLLLGSHPAKMPVGRILEFTSLFELSEGAVRTALSRLVTAGDLDNDDGVYRLTGRLLERQAQQDSGRHEPPAEWDRTWWTVAVLTDRRPMAERRAFRTRAAGARLGELKPDMWFRPANIALPPGAFDEASADIVVTRGPLLVGDDQELARRLWDFDALADAARRHLGALERAVDRLATGDDVALVDVFAALASAQRFLRVEPQLPAEVDPPPASSAVRTTYLVVVREFQQRLAAFFARNGRSDRGEPDRRSPRRVSTAGQ
jgi:phenylacetic acid degradation operon negative regulatory protein